MYKYNTLVLDFLQYKRNLGYKYRSEEIILKEIAKYLSDNDVTVITKEITEKYARINENISQNTLARNMGICREFNKYLLSNDIECYQIPLKLYPQNHHNFIPYVFSYDEIKRIYSNLNFIYNSPNYTYYQKIIYPLIIKLLYQTGMRIGEVISIAINNYSENYFILYNTKNGQDRKVMIPLTLKEEIGKYHTKFHYQSDNDELFFKVKVTPVEKYFKKLLRLSNIKITNNGPRLHDLRHTFIVHTIEKFRKDGKNMDEMLPILQAYVGHQSLASLTYYFHLNNDILQELKNISNKTFNNLIPVRGDENE